MRRRLVIALRIWLVRAGFAAGRLVPIRSRVVLATSHAEGPSGNLAAIRDELAHRTPPIPTVVLAYRPAHDARSRLAAVRHAVAAGFHLATARVFIVDDYFFPIYVIRPRRGTTIVQAWHGCGAFKKFGYSVLDKAFGADEELLRRVRIHANYDICLVSSAAVAPHYAEAFRLPLERFRSDLGIPRTDALLDPELTDGVAAAVRRRYAITADRRIVLYAPTFRGETVTDARFAEALDLRRLRDDLASDHVLLVRLHPFIRRDLAIEADLAGFVIDVSDHPDINALLLAADVLVTDYSSVIFEYALLGRPMAFFAPDLEAYERERGFYFDFRAGVPGPVFDDSGELAAYLRSGTADMARVEAFARASFDVADGHASARFVDTIVVPALAR
ncbi:MAG TPA: CDP-glycerol glycerophosphotransferase family protein [Candidatus Limnocylindrales bacterium]